MRRTPGGLLVPDVQLPKGLRGFMPAFGSPFRSAFASASVTPVVAPWYEEGGIGTPDIAYRFKGAANQAAAYVNLPTPGTYNASPQNTLGFDAAKGLLFTGSGGNKGWIRTGYNVTGTDYTYIVMFANSSATCDIISTLEAYPTSMSMYEQGAPSITALTNGKTHGAWIPFKASGSLTLAGLTGYDDGANPITLNIASRPDPNNVEVIIGRPGTLNAGYFSGEMQFFLLYRGVKTQPQIQAVLAAWAAL